MGSHVSRLKAGEGFGWVIGGRVPSAGETARATESDSGAAVARANEPQTKKLKRLPRRGKLKSARTSSLAPVRRDVVLYVEDDDQNFEVARLRLSRGYELLHAKTDERACEILRSRGQDLSAILMDIELKDSVLDGVALVKLLRQGESADTPSFARDLPAVRAPIFYVTAHASVLGGKELLSTGAVKVVSKPVDFAELTLALTQIHLSRLSS